MQNAFVFISILILNFQLTLSDNFKGIFVNYHITHHAGTTIYFLARDSNLNYDGMNAIYNIGDKNNSHDHYQPNFKYQFEVKNKDEVFNMWHTPITYDYKAWFKRINTTVRDPTKIRNFVSIEQPLIDPIWNILPFDNPLIKNMIIMRNPLTRIIAGDGNMNKKDIAKNGYTNRFKLYNNYALRWLAGIAEKYDYDVAINENNYNVALKRLKSFDHVVIMEDIIETADFLCKEWNWAKCMSISNKDHIHPRLVINNDTLIKEYLDMYYYDIKLYEEAVKISLKQLIEKNYKHDILDKFPDNYKESLLKELETPIENLRRKLSEIPQWLQMEL
jgi:hypothetical protein